MQSHKAHTSEGHRELTKARWAKEAPGGTCVKHTHFYCPDISRSQVEPGSELLIFKWSLHVCLDQRDYLFSWCIVWAVMVSGYNLMILSSLFPGCLQEHPKKKPFLCKMSTKQVPSTTARSQQTPPTAPGWTWSNQVGSPFIFSSLVWSISCFCVTSGKLQMHICALLGEYLTWN